MPRDIPIGNGRILAAFDFDYRIRDFYYPRVGKENHALGYPWRLGVWVDGTFSWVSRREWIIQRDYMPEALVTAVNLSHPRLPIRIVFNDVVDFERNLLIRRARVLNLATHPVEVRLFFHADINALENEIGDTVFFDPKNACLIHYKGPRYFLMSCATESVLGVTHFATGRKRNYGLEGTWKDAENGTLSGNPITQGAVDSVIGAALAIQPNQEGTFYYWLTVGTSYSEVEQLHRYATIETTPDEIIERNINYWRHWLSVCPVDLGDLPPVLKTAYQRSLLVLRTQIDEGGAVIAANDTDIRQFNLDTYSYMWPRDGAVAAQALDRAGYGGLTRRFLRFCTDKAANFSYSASILAETGFLMHKYNPDGSVGSSWHPWIEDDEFQFPIQEDETALVIWAIWHHYLNSRDIDAVREFYRPFVQRAADFLLAFRDDKTGLPLPSYDLWEERRGVFTYTTATVVAGLRAAANLAALFNEKRRAELYVQGASEIRQAIERYLYCPGYERYSRGILFEKGLQRRDPTLDASLLGLVVFGGFDPLEPRVAQTARALEERLWVKGPVGGLARYEGDRYQLAPGTHAVPGNPWVISTLWLAQYRTAIAQDRHQLEEVLPLLLWATRQALPSGVMPEQVHPSTGEFLSVSPLTWSHATFVAAILDYAEKAVTLRPVPSRGGPVRQRDSVTGGQ